MRLGVLATIGMLAAVPAHAGQAGAGDRYVLSSIKADFKARQRIGTKRAGLVCLPAGSFKWSDARAGVSDAKVALAGVLHEIAPDRVDAADDPFSDGSRFRLVATLDTFTLNACVRTWGLATSLNRKRGMTGRVHLTVTWQVFDRTSRASVGRATIDTDYDLAPDTNDAAEALVAGLKANAAQFAQQRWPATHRQ